MKKSFSNTIYHALYTSKSEGPIETETLLNILSVSRIRNSRENITGLLIARDGHYMQLLEGPEAHVKQLLADIKNDPRHTQFTVRAEVTSHERIMKDWSMALATLNEEMSSSRAIIELFELVVSGTSLSSSKETLFIMLNKFSKYSKAFS